MLLYICCACVRAYIHVKMYGYAYAYMSGMEWIHIAIMKFGRYQFSYLIIPHTLANQPLDTDFSTHVPHLGQWGSLQVKARPALIKPAEIKPDFVYI